MIFYNSFKQEGVPDDFYNGLVAGISGACINLFNTEVKFQEIKDDESVNKVLASCRTKYGLNINDSLNEFLSNKEGDNSLLIVLNEKIYEGLDGVSSSPQINGKLCPEESIIIVSSKNFDETYEYEFKRENLPDYKSFHKEKQKKLGVNYNLFAALLGFHEVQHCFGINHCTSGMPCSMIFDICNPARYAYTIIDSASIMNKNIYFPTCGNNKHKNYQNSY